MTKANEKVDENSCLNRAYDDEPLFILRAKDPLFCNLINIWIEARVKYGLNSPYDNKIQEARNIMQLGSLWRKQNPDKIKVVKEKSK